MLNGIVVTDHVPAEVQKNIKTRFFNITALWLLSSPLHLFDQ